MIEILGKSPSRFLFFTGKGGVGKTSLASAVSVALADAGLRVLLISTDPASNLDEVLETPLGNDPGAISQVPGLQAMNIDPAAAAQEYRERIVGPYRGVLPDSAVARIEEQLSGACTTEIASFNEFTRLIGDANAVDGYDHIVLDTAPTGHTLRLLDLPAAWNDFIATNETGSSCLGPLSGLAEQKAVYEQAVATLADADQTTLILVARADAGSLAEAGRAGEELRTAGMTRQQLVVNAVFRAADTNDPIATQMQRDAEQALNDLPPSLSHLPCFEIPFHPTGAVGVQRLRNLFQPTSPVESLPTDDEPLPDFRSLSELISEFGDAGHGVIMTMGKGGVGKTTVAIKIALELARSGKPVLLATTDPADHISGQLPDAPANISVQAINPKLETENHVRHVLETTGQNLAPEARALLEEELRSPCIEEIAVFTAFAKLVAVGAARFVVLDTAPTGHTLLLLDTTEAYHREVERNAGNLSAEVRELLPRLRDPEYTKILLVTLPEATPVHETEDLHKDLQRAGITPYTWVINRSLQPVETSDPLLAAKRTDERQYLREVSQSVNSAPVLVPRFV